MPRITASPNTFCYERDYVRAYDTLVAYDPYGTMISNSSDDDTAHEPPVRHRELRDYDYDTPFARKGSGKPITLRSWRTNSIGGDNRKSAVRKLLLRLAHQPLGPLPSANSLLFAS